jgi:hypothetical protein
MSKAELAELKCVCVCTAVRGFVFWLFFVCVLACIRRLNMEEEEDVEKSPKEGRLRCAQ